MATEEVVFLHLQKALASLTSVILGSGQRVAVTSITSCVNKPQKLGDGATVFSSLPFDEPVQIETNSTFDLTQSYLAVDSNTVSITNTGTSSISITGSSVNILAKETRTFRRISGSWYTTDLLLEDMGSDIADVVLNQHVIPSFIGEAYTNLVLDPTDLQASGSNWTASNTTDELVDIYHKGHQFTKIVNSGALGGYNFQPLTASFINLVITGQVVCELGSISNNEALFIVYNATTASVLFQLTIDFDNYPNVPGTPNGTLLSYKWLDSKRILINYECLPLANLTDDVQIRCYGSVNNIANEYTYWTEVQLIDEVEQTMFPFVEGSYTADVINKEFTLPGKSIHYLEVEPGFLFDTATLHRFFSFYISATQTFRLLWFPSTDKIVADWVDGGTERLMSSIILNSSTLLNQKLYTLIVADLEFGIAGNSRFILFNSDGVILSNTVTWDGTPDVMSSIFNTVSEGHELGVNQIDSKILHRIYSWFTFPSVTTINDVWSALAGKTPLFSATSAPDVDVQTIDENTSLQNVVDKSTKSLQLMKSFDNWHEVGGTNEPAFQNSWANVGSAQETAGFYKDAMGWVHLKGTISSGTLSNAAFTLPNGYKPKPGGNQDFAIVSNSVFGRVRLTIAGGVSPIAPSNNASVYLDNIIFYAGF